jgi:hypothetical protein
MRIRPLRVTGIALCGGAALVGCARPVAPPRQPVSREPPPAVVVTQDTAVMFVTTLPFDTLVAEGTDTVGREGRDPGDRCRYASVRRNARPGDANYGVPYDARAMSSGVALQCAVREGGPELRLVIRGEHGIPTAADVHLPAHTPRPLQRLSMADNDQPAYEGSTLAEGRDLNRDGWTDLKVQTWSGSGGISYALFMYDPARERFVQDSVLPGGGGLAPVAGRREPCVISGHKSGAGNFDDREYCWRGGRWVLVRERRQERLDASPGRFVLTVREPCDGRMVTVRVDTSTTDAAADP